jgi:hypothetical protein
MKYRMDVVRTDKYKATYLKNTTVVHWGDDLIRMIRMATYWMGKGLWLRAEISMPKTIEELEAYDKFRRH